MWIFCFLFNLSLTVVFPPVIALRFFVLLNDTIGTFVGAFCIVPFVYKIGQCLSIILDTFGAFRLYDSTSGIRFAFLEFSEC